MTDQSPPPGSLNAGGQVGISISIPNNDLISFSAHFRPEDYNLGGNEAFRAEFGVKVTEAIPVVREFLSKAGVKLSAATRVSYFNGDVAFNVGGKLSRKVENLLPGKVKDQLKGSIFGGLRLLYEDNGDVAIQLVAIGASKTNNTTRILPAVPNTTFSKCWSSRSVGKES